MAVNMNCSVIFTLNPVRGLAYLEYYFDFVGSKSICSENPKEEQIYVEETHKIQEEPLDGSTASDVQSRIMSLFTENFLRHKTATPIHVNHRSCYEVYHIPHHVTTQLAPRLLYSIWQEDYKTHTQFFFRNENKSGNVNPTYSKVFSHTLHVIWFNQLTPTDRLLRT